jgi:hypothetical protein
VSVLASVLREPYEEGHLRYQLRWIRVVDLPDVVYLCPQVVLVHVSYFGIYLAGPSWQPGLVTGPVPVAAASVVVGKRPASLARVAQQAHGSYEHCKARSH